MFESFTAGAERALERAEVLARRRGAAIIEPLDLLAALVLEAESRAAGLLEESGVDAGRLWEAIGPGPWEDEAGPWPEGDDEPSQPLPRSAALRLVVSEAANQARSLDRSREVGTEHLLAGLMAASDTVAELL